MVTLLRRRRRSCAGLWTPASATWSAWYQEVNTNAAGVVSQWADKSGNGRHLTAAGSPVLGAGVNGNTTYAFDGVNDNYTNATAITTFFPAAQHYCAIGFKPTSITSNNANMWSNHGLVVDSGQNLGIHLKLGATCNGYYWDGASKVAGVTVSTGNWYVFEFWHTPGSNINVRLNGGSITSTVAGNHIASGTLRIGSNGSGVSWFTGEMAFILCANNDMAGTRDNVWTWGRSILGI